MLDADLRRRVERLVQGHRSVGDLDRVFLGLRSRSSGRDTVREVRDVVVHREQRDKGVVTTTAGDILLSAQVWTEGMLGRVPILDDVFAAACANLRIATDEQLHTALGARRQAVKAILNQAISNMRKRKQLSKREQSTLDYLGNRFVWRPAFTDAMLASDLQHVLGSNCLLPDCSPATPEFLSSFPPLYVITLLYGSSILFKDGRMAALKAGYGNGEGTLEINAMLSVGDMPKPVHANVCVFLTSLHAAEHCCPRLLAESTWWDGPLDIDVEGRITPL